MGNKDMVDLMIRDGLSDIFNDYHMGITAENLAKSTISPEKSRMLLLHQAKTRPKLQ